MMERKLLLLGAGGHARVMLDTLRDMGKTPLGCLSRDPPNDNWPKDVLWLGTDEKLPEFAKNEWFVVNGIGSTSNTSLRQAVFDQVKACGLDFITVIHQRTVISADAMFEEGCAVLPGSIVQTGVRVGANVLINTGAILGHDSVVESHVHIAPGVIISGNVSIGQGAHIGAGSVLREGISVGAEAIIGAGAVVLGDIPAGACYVGNPARGKG